MKKHKLKGALLATAVAGLFLSGHAMAEEKSSDSAKKAEVHCAGINSCAGKGGCKSADNSCQGKNGCKGKGWVSVGSEKECTDKGGTVVAGM